MLVGIISYFTNDEKLREKRKKAHKDQLDWIYNTLPNPYVVVCAQNYRPEDFDPRVNKYIDEGNIPIGPCKARNIILRELYASDEDFFIMLDDDTYPYPYYDSYQFFQDLPNPEFRKLDVIGALVPQQVPFKKSNYMDPNLLTHHLFVRKPVRQLQFLILNNFRKLYNEEIYFDENMDPKKGTGQEDEDFLIQILAKGYTMMNCNTLIQNSPAYEASTLFEDREARIKIFEMNAEALVNKWKDYGIVLKENHRPEYKYFYKKYNKSPMRYIIKRGKPLVLTDKEIPSDHDKLDEEKNKIKPVIEIKKKSLLGNWNNV